MTFEEHVYKTKAFTRADGSLMSGIDAIYVSAIGFPPISKREKIRIYEEYVKAYSLDKLRHFKSAFNQSTPMNEKTNLCLKKGLIVHALEN